MKKSLQDFWAVLNKNIKDIGKPEEALVGAAETSAAVLGLAIALGVTAAPAVAISAAALPLVGIGNKTIKAIKSYVGKKNKKLTLEEFVAITARIAYLESFNKLTNRNEKLAKIRPNQDGKTQPDEALGKFILNQELATNALRCFHRSELAQAFNRVLSDQLIQAELSEREAQMIVGWVAWKAQHYLKKAIDGAGDEVEEGASKLATIYSAAQNTDPSQYQSIETYLKEQIANKPKETVFAESFTFEDIYVPLKISPVNANGKVNKDRQFLLEDWAKDILQDNNYQKKVMFIQGGPGQGKTLFCRMFADWTRQHLHPLWTPILIHLRDIDAFEQSFEKTLQGAVKAKFTNDQDWLTDNQRRFLFLLDGFDELRMEGRASGGIERFIKQVGSFQERCQTSEMGHRFIVTGRQLALQGISYLPNNLERVELQEMDDKLQQQWFGKWEAQVGTQENQDFQEFLRADNCPETVKEELAREPLLLYLLAAMHRDGDLKVEDLKGTSSIQTKIHIYEQSLNWVLDKQRQAVQPEIVRLKPKELRRVLIEAGLCVVQSGGEYARINTIEQRLKNSEPDIAQKIKLIKTEKGDEVLKNALAAFYLKPAVGQKDGSVEFFHKSFGEFLCAKRMQSSLEEWTEPRERDRGFYLNDDQLAEKIYDLLGYGGLTSEIVEYLLGLLSESNEFRLVKLFRRLEDFYWRWCNGEFIDAQGTTLPQTKMRQLKEQLPEQKTYLGQQQIDVYTGLNVMILLLELHRYSESRAQSYEIKEKLTFYPCGKPNTKGQPEDVKLLFRLIGYSYCIGDTGFQNTVGAFLSDTILSGADLSGANLSGTNLSGAILSDADLSGAILSHADLSNTILSRANLSDTILSSTILPGADLSDAILSDTNLSGAILSDAILSRANLSRANLEGAILSRANLSGANLEGAILSSAILEDDANLEGANLSGAILRDANLEGAILSHTNLSDATLSGAILSYTYLSNSNLSSANLSGANLSGADLSGADLSNTNLSGADLSNTNLSGADLSNTNLSDAILSYADLSDAILSHADLSNTNLENISWNEQTNWKKVKEWETARNIPEKLKQQLGL